MLNQLRESVTQTLSLVEFNIAPPSEQEILGQQPKMQETRQDPALSGANIKQLNQRPQPESPLPGRSVRNAAFDQNDPATWAATTSRNALCPCGSGQKYKYCHGKLS